VAAKTKSQSPTPVVRKPRPKLTVRNPRPVPSAELGLEPPQSYDQHASITEVETKTLQRAFDHFNRELFNSALPEVVLTPRARASSFGYFSPDRFAFRDGKTRHGEIALNPDAFPERTDKLIMSTLAHEMVHLLQHVNGTASNSNYHNKEWAQMMRSIGLQPTSTGAVGGRETGQRMTHMIVPGGPFELSFQRLEQTGWKLNLQSALFRGAEGRKKKDKATYTCPACGGNAWAKPNYDLDCHDCGQLMPRTK
jgi:predicted SprT family Zn-dependent metalloprotease